MQFIKKYKYALIAALFAVLLIILLILFGKSDGGESVLSEDIPESKPVSSEVIPETTETSETSEIHETSEILESEKPESSVTSTDNYTHTTKAPQSYPAHIESTAEKTEQTLPKTTAAQTAVKPQTEKPQTVKPQTTKPQTTKPQTTKPQTTKPQTEKPKTTKPQTTASVPEKPQYVNSCIFTIDCRSILENMDKLDKDKHSLVPVDGVIFSGNVGFNEGESVYDILRRVCSENNIQLEAAYTPAFGSSYIEGINNLYEFDCGSASGWIYKVNGNSPSEGCSSYLPKNGDSIEFCYNC